MSDGYLLVHFVEDHEGHGEKIYFSLSDHDDPLRWTRVNGGEAVLESGLGTTGVRDPYLVRGPEESFIIATDLRVWTGVEHDWDGWTRSGSRSLVVWRSMDLVAWSEPWRVEVAPPTAGMAWAAEALYDAATGEYLVYWSSALYEESDAEHAGDSYSRIVAARTGDFRSFGAAFTLADFGPGHGVIDLTMVEHEGRTHRFLKSTDERRLFHEVGASPTSPDFTLVASRIADDLYEHVEAPLIFFDAKAGWWYLWVDQYSDWPQGYIALRTRDLAGGDWQPVPRADFSLPANTKHGVVVPLRPGEWDRLAEAFAG
ncbi:glycoside hydrolase family 43 protein [Microbacterium sp. NPDC056234]|uniref:glycoside hydrolase family 43 protein n=1 Tax=Microbacterium sp. NPDC056234 TaxID=3345757 RepID=UPI0035D9FBBE